MLKGNNAQCLGLDKMEDQRIPVAMETFSKGSLSDVTSSCPLALHLFSRTCIIQYHNVMSPPTIHVHCWLSILAAVWSTFCCLSSYKCCWTPVKSKSQHDELPVTVSMEQGKESEV